MKKFAVLKKIGCFHATCVRDFDNPDDAKLFKNLLAKTETNGWEYFVVEVLE